MTEVTVFESRVNKLEQDNRRLKLALGALLLVLTVVPLVGAVMPEQVPQVITARQFRVIDNRRRPRLNKQLRDHLLRPERHQTLQCRRCNQLLGREQHGSYLNGRPRHHLRRRKRQRGMEDA